MSSLVDWVIVCLSALKPTPKWRIAKQDHAFIALRDRKREIQTAAVRDEHRDAVQ